MTLRAQLVLLTVLSVATVAALTLASLRASTFQAFTTELRKGLSTDPYVQGHRQRCLDLARIARYIGSDQKFLQLWNSSLNVRTAFAQAAPGVAQEKLRQSDILLDLHDQCQRFFLDQDTLGDNTPRTEHYGAVADLFILADAHGHVIMDITTARDGLVEIQFPLTGISTPKTLSLDRQPLINQGLLGLSAAGYLRYADGHLYQAVVFATPQYGTIPGGLVILGDRVDGRLASQVSLNCASADTLFVDAEHTPLATSNDLVPLPSMKWEAGTREVKIGSEPWLACLFPLESTAYSMPDFKPLERGDVELGWLVLLKPTRVVDQLAVHQLWSTTAIVGSVAILVALLSSWMGGQMARPIQSLSESLLKVGQGNLEVEIKPEGPHDVKEAAQAFNRMVAGLRDKETLEKFVSRLEELRLAADLSDPLVRDQAQFGRFVVVAKLGAGGMATVYKGLPADTLDESGRVALKIMHSHLEYGPRLVREYEVMTRLDHQGIVHVLDSGEKQGRFYIAMEFVEGVPLSQRLAQGALPFREFTDYADQLLAAIHYAHGQNIIHRDLKPDNIMVTPNGLKVMDFGLAAGLDMARLTASGDVMGTPAYVAPEQISGGNPGFSADQYSLGIIFYEMVAGQRPFDSSDVAQLITDHLVAPPPPLEKFRHDVPPAINAVIRRMLKKEPAERFPDLEAVRRALYS